MKIFLIHILFITPGICFNFDPHVVTDISHWLDNGKTCFGEDYVSNDDYYYYDDEESDPIPRSWPTRVSLQNPVTGEVKGMGAVEKEKARVVGKMLNSFFIQEINSVCFRLF